MSSLFVLVTLPITRSPIIFCSNLKFLIASLCKSLLSVINGCGIASLVNINIFSNGTFLRKMPFLCVLKNYPANPSSLNLAMSSSNCADNLVLSSLLEDFEFARLALLLPPAPTCGWFAFNIGVLDATFIADSLFLTLSVYCCCTTGDSVTCTAGFATLALETFCGYIWTELCLKYNAYNLS